MGSDLLKKVSIGLNSYIAIIIMIIGIVLSIPEVPFHPYYEYYVGIGPSLVFFGMGLIVYDILSTLNGKTLFKVS